MRIRAVSAEYLQPVGGRARRVGDMARVVLRVEIDSVPTLREVDVRSYTLWAHLLGQSEAIAGESWDTVVARIALVKASVACRPVLGARRRDVVSAAVWVTNDHSEALEEN